MKTKRSDVEYYIEKVNVILKNKGKDYYYHFTSRYNYYAIDKCFYYNSGSADYRSGLTLKEAYNIIYCLYESLYDLEYNNNEFEILKNASLKDLYNICGYREFNILRTASYTDIETEESNEEHHVYRIYNHDHSEFFLYDIKNKIIVG